MYVSTNWFVALAGYWCGLQRQAASIPTDPFPILELQNQSHNIPEQYQIILPSLSEALKMSKGPVGMFG